MFVAENMVIVAIDDDITTVDMLTNFLPQMLQWMVNHHQNASDDDL